MFSALQKAGLKRKPPKMQVISKHVNYLGHVISAEGITIGNDRMKANSELPDPKNSKESRSFLGTPNFVRRFVSNFLESLRP